MMVSRSRSFLLRTDHKAGGYTAVFKACPHWPSVGQLGPHLPGFHKIPKQRQHLKNKHPNTRAHANISQGSMPEEDTHGRQFVDASKSKTPRPRLTVKWNVLSLR